MHRLLVQTIERKRIARIELLPMGSQGCVSLDRADGEIECCWTGAMFSGCEEIERRTYREVSIFDALPALSCPRPT